MKIRFRINRASLLRFCLLLNALKHILCIRSRVLDDVLTLFRRPMLSIFRVLREVVKIRHVFPLVDVSGSNLPRLEKVALAAWALCFLPIVGPLVPVCLIIVWTMPNRCDVEKQNFIGQARVNGSKLQEYWMNVIEKSETTWDDWEDSEFFKGWFHSRCGRANIMNWAFLAVFMYLLAQLPSLPPEPNAQSNLST